jgi:hypothetical protein
VFAVKTAIQLRLRFDKIRLNFRRSRKHVLLVPLHKRDSMSNLYKNWAYIYIRPAEGRGAKDGF